tara:strand:- start:2007 stop:2501 length:495 start_codon:yes stop_codon:yes gene_type:complete
MLLMKIICSIMYPFLANFYVLMLVTAVAVLVDFVPLQPFSFIVHTVSLLPVFYFILWKRDVTELSQLYAWLIGTLVVSVIMIAGTAIVETVFREAIRDNLMDVYGKAGKVPSFIESIGIFTSHGISFIFVGLMAAPISIVFAKLILQSVDTTKFSSPALESENS